MSFPDMIQMQPPEQQGSLDKLSAEYNLLASKLDAADRKLGNNQNLFPTDYPTDFDAHLRDLIDKTPLV